MAEGHQAALAYLTVEQDPRSGWTGGLLVLGPGGRPLEFQCTLPVQPSRTHEILFGNSLRHHIIAEVIGPLLIKKCRTLIAMLCCDQAEAFRIGDSVRFPVGLVRQAAAVDEGPIDDTMLPHCETVQLVGSPVDVPMERYREAQTIADAWSDLPDAVEPFERIREAIAEARKRVAAARAATNAPPRQPAGGPPAIAAPRAA